MENEIVNRVASSTLEVFDLEDYYPEGKRVGIDISQWLKEGFLLIEKDFRNDLAAHDWSQYQDVYAAVYCSTDAIIPAWAEILVTLYLAPFAKRVISGDVSDIEGFLYDQILAKIDYSPFKDKPVIIKGCARKPVPASAYVTAAQNLRPFAKSIMYGEACSAVPLFKRK